MVSFDCHDCDEISGIVDSMQQVALDVVGCHMAGWFDDQDGSGYFYGFGVPLDYEGDNPKGFKIKEFPASTYLVFFRPPFDYIPDNGVVIRNVQELANNLNLNKNDYWWIQNGYEVLRPVKKISRLLS